MGKIHEGDLVEWSDGIGRVVVTRGSRCLVMCAGGRFLWLDAAALRRPDGRPGRGVMVAVRAAVRAAIRAAYVIYREVMS